MINPFAGDPNFTLHRDWAAHGGLGGLDYATGASSGKAVRSPVGGEVIVSGLITAVVNGVSYQNSWLKIRETGTNYVSVFMHMRNQIYAAGAWVAEGWYLGESGGAAGDWGKGQSTGPHLHWHLEISGARADPLNYVTSTTPSTPALSTEEEEHMAASGFLIRNSSWNVSWYSRVTGKRRALTTAEWNVALAEVGGNAANVEIVVLSDADFLALPV